MSARRFARHIPTILGAIVGGFIVHYRDEIFELLDRMAASPNSIGYDTKSVLTVDKEHLRAVREDGAILLYRMNDGQEQFVVVREEEE